MQPVSTTIVVDADNYDEACEIARDSFKDCAWDGMGVEEDTIRISNWEVVE